MAGTEPNRNSPLYKKPITLRKQATIKARVYAGKEMQSDVVSGTYKYTSLQKPERITNKVKNGIVYNYYEGDWKKLPEFSKEKIVEKGIINKIDLQKSKRDKFFAMQYKGYFKAEKDGIYTFYINSNDGSRLYLRKKLFIDNDGLHGPVELKENIGLKAGFYPLEVLYFQSGGSTKLSVSYSGPGIDKRELSVNELYYIP